MRHPIKKTKVLAIFLPLPSTQSYLCWSAWESKFVILSTVVGWHIFWLQKVGGGRKLAVQVSIFDNLIILLFYVIQEIVSTTWSVHERCQPFSVNSCSPSKSFNIMTDPKKKKHTMHPNGSEWGWAWKKLLIHALTYSPWL